MIVKNTLWIMSATLLVGLGILAALQQGRIRLLQAAEDGADGRAREAADQLAQRRATDSADSLVAMQRTATGTPSWLTGFTSGSTDR